MSEFYVYLAFEPIFMGFDFRMKMSLTSLFFNLEFVDDFMEKSPEGIRIESCFSFNVSTVENQHERGFGFD